MEVDIQTPPKENGQPKSDELSPKLIEVPETNGKSKTPDTPKRQTRSRSKTPQKKKQQQKKSHQKEQELNTIKDAPEPEAEAKPESTTNGEKLETNGKEPSPEIAHNENLNGNIEEELKGKEDEKAKEIKKTDQESIEMEPLVLNSDEPDPELEFDENSDLESGKSSPLIPRLVQDLKASKGCKTRRSQTRNIPTPKTPKSLDNDQDSDKNSLPPPTPEMILEVDSPRKSTPKKFGSFDNTYDSIELNISTRAEVGSDATRLNFDIEESMGESFLQHCRNTSLRGLSARRSIRAANNDDYLKRAIRNNHEKSDLNMPLSGVKRKNRSETPEDRKKIKIDSPGLFTMLSSPIAILKNRFRTDLPTSTPKLTGYKDKNNGLSYTENQIEIENGISDKKSWCSIM